MITVQNLCKYYDKNKLSEQYVLKNISLSLPNTGLISIFGPSGCGKTTLLNILSGLDTPTSGTVHYNDIPVTDDFRYENVGVIFQDYSLLEDKTVEENIKLGYLNATDQVLEDTLKALDIVKLKDRRVSMLSGGEKQRVSIARALIKKPAYIVADEPTGNLDLKNRMRVMQILKSLSSHMLVILVSHDQELVSQYSNRIITLADGEVVQDKVISSPNEKTDYEVKIEKNKFNLATYLKDNFKMKHKTNFIVILFMIALTMLICMLSANITGYKYNSASISNNYITLNETLSYEAFNDINDKGNFLFEIELDSIIIPEEKSFTLATNKICIKNSTIKLYPYQNENILYSKETNTNYKQAYLTLRLAKRLIKEGRIYQQYQQGFITLKDLYITKVEDLLGSNFSSHGRAFEITGIVESDVEGILFNDSYYSFYHRFADIIPYSVYKHFKPQANEIERGYTIQYGFQPNNVTIDSLGYKNNIYIIQEQNQEETFILDNATIDYILNDYDYYEETQLSTFYTAHLKEVTSILDNYHISYSLNLTEYKKEVNEASKILAIIFLSVTITFLVFSLFFMIIDTTNYINDQLPDIIVLRNLGITKSEVIHTYYFKLLFKLLPSLIIGFITGILTTYHFKSFNQKTSFMLQVNFITLLLSIVGGFIIISITIYLYLLKRFSFSASTLKIKNKV
ncbi:MAG: ATP-binding cassette domain-containing protein [Roseburia sp.]|nr:ATP-binding cassette domain-containing protein [Anaeroplasma bactoclasticum]MCM1196878.1 ATP-binding cassette domain-containing protein [Roseburia sp.]MCM1556973.1 ATP-binding cassette domain-containing protein [Anaeroplasma bactoclasticum]